MVLENIIEKNGNKFRTGASIREVGPGDIIETTTGRIETIKKITPSPGSKWNKDIHTESGRKYNMMQVGQYGKKQDQ